MVLNIVEFLLKKVFGSNYIVLLLLLLLILIHTYAIMTESSNKRKRNSSNSQTFVAVRGNIDANWKKFLSSVVMNQTDKPVQEEKKEHFTGTFRRSRKKKSKNSNLNNNLQKNTTLQNKPKEQESVENDLQTLNINTKSNKLPVDPANNLETNKQSPNSKNKLTKFVALDCEMVGIGHDGNDNMLARVSIVNKFGDCIYDKYVKAREEVVDYRTSVSGIRKEDMLNGEDFNIVQKEVAEILKGRVLVGHALSHDLGVLFLSHPKRNIRDTSKYKPFRQITKGSTPSLKRLAKEILGVDIQSGEHSSVDDARAVMQLYCTVAKKWENMQSQKRGYNKKILEE